MGDKITELIIAARAVVIEIDKYRGRKIDKSGILDPLHPIAIFGEHLRTALNNLEEEGRKP